MTALKPIRANMKENTPYLAKGPKILGMELLITENNMAKETT